MIYNLLTMKESTSWQKVEKWYDRSVGEKGHYYHQQVILPNLMKMMGKQVKSVLDLGCGQGVLARHISAETEYLGVDIAPALIKAAKKLNKNDKHQYLVGDLSKPLELSQQNFDFATIVLALQNMENPKQLLETAAKHLKKTGQLVIVLNHPCFRIPRQTSWQVDQANKIQYRRVDRYLSTLKIPIQMHPGKKEQIETLSFHHPLSAYFHWLKETGFAVIDLQEWCSDKVSEGGAAKMENRARQEFPLFMAILAKKG